MILAAAQHIKVTKIAISVFNAVAKQITGKPEAVDKIRSTLKSWQLKSFAASALWAIASFVEVTKHDSREVAAKCFLFVFSVTALYSLISYMKLASNSEIHASSIRSVIYIRTVHISFFAYLLFAFCQSQASSEAKVLVVVCALGLSIYPLSRTVKLVRECSAELTKDMHTKESS